MSEPPLSKKKQQLKGDAEQQQVVVQFVSVEDQELGNELVLDKASTIPMLNEVLGKLQTDQQVKDESQRHSFFVGDSETPLRKSLAQTLEKVKDYDGEKVLKIKYKPDSLFAVRPVTRATATLEGHGAAILCCNFSPDGKRLATGSGDHTVRFWDLNTCTPEFTGKGHSGNVLVVAFSPDAGKLVSADYQGSLLLWKMGEGEEPQRMGTPLVGHKKWVTAVAWEPMHQNPDCSRYVSASKDQTLRIWKDSMPQFVLSGHSGAVTCVAWGGEGVIYSGSQDQTVKLWSAKNGRMMRELKAHAHWVNTLTVSTEYVLRTACYDHDPKHRAAWGAGREEQVKIAKKRYEAARGLGKHERVVSGSDDFSLFLWEPLKSKKPVCRLTGHSKLVNQVSFSPNGQLLVSASFDSSIKVWDGFTGRFISTLKGHISSVYRVAWSADSRLLVSGSKDTTLKVWDLRTCKLLFDLPGHADEVYAVDWSPNGEKVASGSKDKRLRLWAN